MVYVPLEINKEHVHFYAVTARHVVERVPNPVLRVNLKSGKFVQLETNGARWIPHPDGDDLAVCPIGLDKEIQFSAVGLEDFYSPLSKLEIFPGDEVFMIGRFTSHEGKQRNAPSVRFGNLSMLPIETMESLYKKDQETYLIEQHSLPGYSGSPVFVVVDETKPRPQSQSMMPHHSSPE